jgi:hypothetical protein
MDLTFRIQAPPARIFRKFGISASIAISSCTSASADRTIIFCFFMRLFLSEKRNTKTAPEAGPAENRRERRG